MAQSLPKPVYILHGQDEYLRRRRSEEIVRRLVGRDETNLTVTKLDASAELSDVLDELRTAPLLAPMRVVIVREADKFVVAHAEALERYLAAPARTAFLILLIDSWPPKTPTGQAGKEVRERVKSLDRIVRKVGELTNCSPIPASSLPKWIAETTQAQSKRIAPQAARLLAEWIGNDLYRLDGEIGKLAIYVDQREEITVEDVSAVVVATVGSEPFALTNAIGRRNTHKALGELSALMTRRGEEIRTLGMLGWHVRKTLAGAGRSAAAQAQSRRDARRLLAADLAIKTGADPVTTMQLLVTRMCI